MTILINNTPIQRFNFPAGECQVRIPEIEGNEINITALLKNSDDIMDLLLTVDGIKRVNINLPIKLTIPYLPYSRQDKVHAKGEALSLNVMAGLVNSLNCSEVTIFDPHSKKTQHLIKKSKIVSCTEIITDNKYFCDFITSNNLVFLSPDKGSKQKVLHLAKALTKHAKQEFTVINASKKRNKSTGFIESIEINGDVTNKDIIIVDDICDGGSTFIHAAKKLKELGANKLFLYVTHGIFSKGIQILLENYQHIFCHHTLRGISHSKLTVFKHY